MPLKQFVWLNRSIIKITHFPVLFCIYLYERFWLAPSMFEPTDLVENPGRGRERNLPFADSTLRTVMFSPNARIREESVAGFHKDRALEEVFRLAPESLGLRTQRRNERRKTQTAIRHWMDQHDADASSATNWPTVESRAVPDWRRRLSVGWDRPSNLRRVSDVRSTASDPADLMSNLGGPSMPRNTVRDYLPPVASEYKDQTDADGDDELLTNDETEDDNATYEAQSQKEGDETAGEEDEHFTTPMTSRMDYFTTPMTARVGKLGSSHGSSVNPVTNPATPRPSMPRRNGLHSRTLSTTTILYNPEERERKASRSSSSASPGQVAVDGVRQSGRSSGEKTPRRRSSPRRPSPRRTTYISNKARPTMPLRGITETGGVSRSALLSIEPRNRPRGARRLSSADLSILSDNMSMPYAADHNHGGLAGSFQTQMAMAMMKDNQLRNSGGGDSADRMGRLVLARMRTLEESFAEMIKEMRDMKGGSTSTSRPVTRRNSSAGDLDLPLIEVAKTDRQKKTRGDITPKRAAGKRPVSRRSMKENKVGLLPPMSPQDKGKGKELAWCSTDDGAKRENSFIDRGGSL